ncbi:MAG: hypothetical protein BWY99_02094 [Synergistetes bacterium ADurb.BinA166]|nr:MAG: hypothetical protein BWY99_02094 [Synergistetes bacterium ADurb.BinA166]
MSSSALSSVPLKSLETTKPDEIAAIRVCRTVLRARRSCSAFRSPMSSKRAQ